MSTVSVEHALQLAAAHLAGGRLPDAERICRDILAAFPEQPGALHLLAGVALQAGRGDLAQDFLRRTLAADPTDAGAHLHYGELLHASARREEATACYERALALQPDLAEAHYWLGRVRRETGQFDDAIARLVHAVELAPNWTVALKELSKALLARQRANEARTVLERVLMLDPNDADAHNDYGVAANELDQGEIARQHLARAVELRPNDALIVNNLGFTLAKLKRWHEARQCYERALELRPGYPNAYNNLGIAYRNLGQPERGLEFSRLAVAGEPDSAVYASILVLAAYYHPSLSKEEIATELRGWNERIAAPLRRFQRPHDNGRDPARRLRVGYVSPDLNIHVISHFMVPLLEAHDPAEVEVHCYASVAVPDVVTERLRRAADRWHEVRGLNDLELAARVRADGIDVLVDLSLHTSDNRLRTFACKPAPVQVSWLGFAGSTGADAIEYRLTDAHMDPPGLDESWSSETPVRLPDGWCCFSPLHETPPVAPLPALRNGYVTFGSLNNIVKVNAPTLRRWALALRAVGSSRLLLYAPEGDARAFVLGVLAGEGIEAGRVEFVGWQAGVDYLRTYDRIDVGLDPFPFNGMTTTCDALWRGVPVLALPGELPHARAGLSLLRVVGLDAWVAGSEEEYARKAAELTANLSRLQRLRAGLRRRMQESPLMDAPRFARNVEAAYRAMWKRWAAGTPAGDQRGGERR